MGNALVSQPRFVTESYSPTDEWKPFRLINDKLRITHKILQPMTCIEIVREVLKDDTPSSNLSKLIKGKCKRINGWRCEYL